MEWKTFLASITGTVDQDLLWRNEYRVAENRMLRKQTPGCVWLIDGERTTVAELGTRFRKKALAEVVAVVNSETLLAWHGKLLARNLRNSRKE